MHSLSQPLTSLRCSLELSIDEVAEQQQKGDLAALQQTEKVIGMIRLMREYLDAEHPGPGVSWSGLAPALRSVTEELSSIAQVRGLRLHLSGYLQGGVAGIRVSAANGFAVSNGATHRSATGRRQGYSVVG